MAIGMNSRVVGRRDLKARMRWRKQGAHFKSRNRQLDNSLVTPDRRGAIFS